ncbi:MAG: hypothetical protein A3G34_02130 [Candidatus Lindowbacteria bacterium RIFCSPLOWO2_12_FULL_62_27]|nr:MAG: hypothetical protein A3G34_02130 [Candidatus Lindowbacteria bacterium RIFCSPLOWO2_12_FULL_62_27]
MNKKTAERGASHAAPKKSPVLTEQTQPILEALEEIQGYPVIAFWHSSNCEIGHSDVDALAHVVDRAAHADTIGLSVKSDGGSGHEALRFIHFLRNYYKRVILFAPFECASAATMLALGCDEIHMGPGSFLTAVDVSLRHPLSPTDSDKDPVSVSHDEMSRIIRLWNEHPNGNPFPEVYKYIHPLVIGAVDRASSLSIRICKELLSYHMSDGEKAERISRELNSAYPSHSYPITAREAARLGLNVKAIDPEIESGLRKLNELYSTMGQFLRSDIDEEHHHDNLICHILERRGRQIYYLQDRDWYYRKDEQKWCWMNNESAWHCAEQNGRGWTDRIFHVS